MAKKTVYQCTKCGTMYADDYEREWGRKYGHGLGPSPVCEALDSQYCKPIVWPEGSPELAMHPVGVCRGMVIPQLVDEGTPTAILAIEDPFMQKRSKLMQSKQRENSPELDVHLKKLNINK